MGIQVINTNRQYRINESLVKNIIADILTFIKKPGTADIELVFMDNKAIRAFNKRYKGADRPTDVLSFGIDRAELGEEKFLGEIFISIDKALENSKAFKTEFTDELVRYIIHGILHLFGYDDSTEKERARMSKKETKVLNDLCIRRTLSKVLTPR